MRKLALLRARNPLAFNELHETTCALVEVMESFGFGKHTLDGECARSVIVNEMPPTAVPLRAGDGAHETTCDYEGEVRRRRQRDEVLLATACERVERAMARCEALLAQSRAFLRSKDGGK